MKMDENLKLAIIAPSVDLNNGWGRYSVSIIDALREKGIDATVIVKKNPKTLMSFVRDIIDVRRAIKDADIIHAFDGWPFGVYGYFAVLGTRKRLFISGIGTYSVAPLAHPLKRFFLKRAYIRARAIFCISNYTNRAIKLKVRNANTVTIFMGLSKLPGITSREAETYKKQYGLHDHYPVILTVGEVKHRKGQFDTLKAIKLLKKEYPDIFYIMVGSKDRNYVAEIEKYAWDNNLAKNIKLIDSVKDDRSLSFFYGLCDVFVLNSNNDGDHFEGFGLVMLEAAQFGKPVVGSKNCGIEDSVGDNYNGYLTNQADSRQIAMRIGDILNGDQELWSKNSIEFSGKFSWDKTAEEYIKNYKIYE